MYEKYKLIYTKDDVYVYDSTKSKDPNVFIVNSYSVKGYRDKLKIINIIFVYINTLQNTKWKRTQKSMMVEFYVHNIAYYVFKPFQKISCFKRIVSRAQNTDFTLSDESKYNISLPFQFIRNMIGIIKS